MSYLRQPRIFFSGTFRANPSTVNNTPDNYNPNCNFPPANGTEVGNNIQLYWNPNGTGEFALDCTVTRLLDVNGDQISKDPILGQPLVSRHAGSPLHSAKLVDLDPMQQNVTELWGLSLRVGSDDKPVLFGDFLAAAYSNAWVQVVGGRGDYAGSAIYQSVLNNVSLVNNTSPAIEALVTSDFSGELSISFVLRAFNSSSLNYLISDETLWQMKVAGVPKTVTERLVPIEEYSTGPHGGEATPGQIPTTSYFKKLVTAMLSEDQLNQYWDAIQKAAKLPYRPATEFDFTHGQAFGVIGLQPPGEPKFMCADRMLTPPSVSTDTAAYDGYFAPIALDPASNSIAVNLGNALPSTRPAAADNSYVDSGSLGDLTLCYFNGEISLDNAVSLGSIDYQSNDFYLQDGGLARLNVEPGALSTAAARPLGIISATASDAKIVLQENAHGYYLRANQFVFRMNPGVETTASEPRGRTQQVEIYATRYGQPLANTEISIALMPSVAAAEYTNGTLGTGGSSGLVNMSVPESALHFPPRVTTDADGIASFTITATDPGNPRGYVDGQIYFLQYGFSDAELKAGYVQSPDDLISIQIYSRQPDIEEVTWENFVQSTLGLYGKLYPVMGFLDLETEQGVIDNACEIHAAINRAFDQGDLMPVTRDLSASRLRLLNAWLKPHLKDCDSG